MADTERTLNDLLTNLFQDGQGAGSISEQDMRDLIVSLIPGYSSMYISSSAETSIAGVNTPVKVAGTTTEGAKLRDFTHTNGRLTYTGAPIRAFIITAALSFTVAANSKVIAFHIAKNGTPIAASEQHRKAGIGADVGSTTVLVEVELNTDDYVELFVENTTDDTNATVLFMNMELRGLVE